MADPFTEGAALADGEYGWGKLIGEMALKAYHKQSQLKGIPCRLFIVYDPRENESHAIMALIAKALLRQDPYVVVTKIFLPGIERCDRLHGIVS